MKILNLVKINVTPVLALLIHCFNNPKFYSLQNKTKNFTDDKSFIFF